MNKWIRRIGIVCLIPVAFVLLVSVLLYIPAIQNVVIRKATEYVGKMTDMQIGIERIRLSFPLDLTVRGVEVLSQPISSADTILTLKELNVSIRALPLLQKQILVDAIRLQDMRINTGNLIEGIAVKGMLDHFYAYADRVDLTHEQATLNMVELSDAAFTLFLSDTVTEEDTTSVPVNWLLNLEKISLDRVSLAMQMMSDSLCLTAYIDRASLLDGKVDLGKMQYSAAHFDMRGSSVGYDENFGQPQSGLDLSHIRLNDLTASLSSLRYGGRDILVAIDSFAVKERSGLEITSLSGEIHSDDQLILVPDLRLKTLSSEIHLNATVPWEALEERPNKDMNIRLTGSVGKEDLLIAASSLPDGFKQAYPDRPLLLTAVMDGNLSALRLQPFVVELPGAVKLKASGKMESVADSIRRSGEMDFWMETGNLEFALTMLPASMQDYYRIPEGMRLKGNAAIANRRYHTDLELREGTGAVRLSGMYDPVKLAYKADLTVDSLEPTHFMPKDSLYGLTASLRVEGKGTDPFAASTWAKLDGTITDIRYGESSLSNVSLNGELREHLLQVDLLSKYPLAQMDLTLNATLHKNDVKAMLIADVEQIDLHQLHFMEKPFATSFQLFAEAESDLDENNKLDVTLGNWDIVVANGTFRPKMLTLHARSDADTTRVSFHAGDLGIMLTGNDCIHDLADKLVKVSDEAGRQFERDSAVNLNRLRPLLPDMHLEVRAGQDNPIYNYLQNYYVDFNSLALNASLSPEAGFRMDASLFDLARDTLVLDTIRAEVHQDTLGLLYNAEVVKKRYRQQQPFYAGLEGQIRYGFGDARLSFKNGKGDVGLLLGIRADKIENGLRFHLFPDNPIIAFRPFQLNPDNYITFRNAKDIAANVHLSGENNASLWIHSEANGEGMDEIHTELGQINLGIISEAFSYLPVMDGILNADFKYAPSDSAFMVVGDMDIDDLYYEKERVGEMMFNAVYLPLEEGNHQIDMHLFRDREEISAITALYQSGETDHITGNILFTHLPLAMVNPFIPDDMAKLGGDLDGEMLISGTSAAPKVDGYLILDTASVYVGAVGSTFRFDEKKIEVNGNRILFDNYNFYAYGKNPLTLSGKVDFNDLSRMTADLKMTASDLQLLNVKRGSESLVYGKLFVNLNSTVRGPLDALTMRGDLQLLGNTNVTYVLKDSPLTVQDRLSDMVTFTSFADTVRRRMPQKPPLPLGGMDMLMTIRIAPAVQMNVDLSPDQSSHINLEGGGDLSFQYTPQGDMLLNGRYTLSGGTIKYALPVIPLKEFSVQEGSYVQWTGNPMDPLLNLTATERVRTSVSLDGQSPRPVNFDVGIELKQRLENLGLNFTLSAPEDMAMEEELTSKGSEERAKLAVSMLVTGMYLGGGTGGGKVNLNMGDALNSFLQSEINNIAGSALKTVDITFGMESYDENGSDSGGSRTDYSFRFAKRFYNDRIRVILGGRISTGENINNGQAQPFIDNVSVEYRLDNSGSRYVKLFHNKNYESLLEGEVIETGAGVVLRKKMMHLRELFNFKKNKKIQPINEKE